MPSTLPRTGLRIGTPTQEKARSRSVKCSAPCTVTTRDSSSAVPTPFVPACSSVNPKPGAMLARSSRPCSDLIPTHRWMIRASGSASSRLCGASDMVSTKRSMTGCAALNRRLSSSKSSSNGSDRSLPVATPQALDRSHERSITGRIPKASPSSIEVAVDTTTPPPSWPQERHCVTIVTVSSVSL